MSRLHITGFRGVADLDLTIEPQTPIYLIGGNNSGKSTVLNAFALVLRGGGFHTFTPTEFDFHRATTGRAAEDFSISLHFEADELEHLPAVQGVGSPVPVHGIRVVGRRKKDKFEHRHQLFDADGKAITLSSRTALKGDAKEAYREHGLGWTQYYARLDDIRKFLPEVWLLRPDNLDRSLYHWRTGPLQRLAKLLSERFLEQEWEFEYGGKRRQMPETIGTVHTFFQEAVEKFPFWQKDLRPRLESALGSYIGRSATIGLRPSIQSIQEWLEQQLAVSFAAEAGGPLTPLQAMGDGWQSLVRMAALESLQHYEPEKQDPVLLLFEEPESFLHPHLRRKLRSVLERLAAAHWIPICSTHAPEFISFSRPQQIVRLWRMGSQSTHGVLLSGSIPEGPKFQEKLEERGNHEFLFGRRAILCEGKDDCFALTTYFDKIGTDLDGLSVSIVDLGGIDNMPSYASIAKSLGIPWCALTDEDIQPDGILNPKTDVVREQLIKLSADQDLVPVWPGSLERSLSMTQGKATPVWQEKHIAVLTVDRIASQHPQFSKTCKSIADWLTSSVARIDGA
jgi:ABC-type arginine transport system ATPase subunit